MNILKSALRLFIVSGLLLMTYAGMVKENIKEFGLEVELPNKVIFDELEVLW